jgi:ankyrin repeat protein
MKFNLSGLLPLALIICCACGKKAEEEKLKSFTDNYRPSEAEVYFNALQELRRSVQDNDLLSLKRLLIDNPQLDLNKLGDDGETLLTIAIKRNYTAIRNYLIDKGVDLEKANIHKETPLIAAALSNRLNSTKILIDRGVEINKKDSFGNTALHIAIKNRNEDLALFLIKSGANVEITEAMDRNAYKLAEEYQTPRVMELIKSIMQTVYGSPDISSFKNVITMGDVKALNQMLTRFPRIAIDYESINPLALVLEIQDETLALNSAQLLISYQANVDGPKNADITPLIRSVQAENLAITQVLIKENADINLVDNKGKSALIHAVEKRNLPLVNLMMNNGAKISYSAYIDGYRYDYDACKIARKIDSSSLKKSLGCSFWTWIF